MAQAGTWITQLDTAITTPLNTFVSQGASGVSTYATAPLSAAVTLYVMVFGISIMTGRSQQPVSEFITFALKLGFVLFLVQGAGNYTTYVTAVVQSMPGDIAAALGQGQGASTAVNASGFDALLSQGLSVGGTIMKTASIWSPGSTLVNGIAGLAVMVFVAFLAAVGYCMALYAKVALALCLALGPIFIVCAVFNATRPFFEHWIKTLFSFVILQVLILALGSLVIGTFNTLATAAAAGTSGDVLLTAIGTFAYCTASAFLFRELPQIAHGLSGGVSLNGAGGGGVVSSTALRWARTSTGAATRSLGR